MTPEISNTTIWETSKGYMTGIFVRFPIDQKKNIRGGNCSLKWKK